MTWYMYTCICFATVYFDNKTLESDVLRVMYMLGFRADGLSLMKRVLPVLNLTLQSRRKSVRHASSLALRYVLRRAIF